MFSDLISRFFDCLPFGFSDRPSEVPIDHGSSTTHTESASSSAEPSAFNAFGTAACDIQCASEASSITPSFSCTTDTWGSIGSSDFGSGSDSWK